MTGSQSSVTIIILKLLHPPSGIVPGRIYEQMGVVIRGQVGRPRLIVPCDSVLPPRGGSNAPAGEFPLHRTSFILSMPCFAYYSPFLHITQQTWFSRRQMTIF